MDYLQLEKKLKKEINTIYSLHSITIEDFIQEFLNNIVLFQKQKKISSKFLENLDIPYFLISKSLKILEKYLSQEIYKLEELISKTYLKRGAIELLSFLNHQYTDKLLFLPHNKFIQQIHDSLLKNDLSLFPKKHFQDCEFQQILNYPKAKMILRNNIKELEKLHNSMHIIANTLYKALNEKKFSDAVFILENFKETVLKFIQLISEAYFEAYENIENRFFGVVEYFHQKKDIYLTIIDVKNLKYLNIIYGENTINKALKILRKRIEYFMKSDYKKTITIKAESTNFYMMNIDYSSLEYQLLINHIYQTMTAPIEIEGTVVTLPVIIGEILLPKYFKAPSKKLCKS